MVTYINPELKADAESRESALAELIASNDALRAVDRSDDFAVMRAVERTEAAMNRIRAVMEET